MIGDKMKTYIFDLDGTMYRGNEVIEDARLTIEKMHQLKLPYVFLTNNATRTRTENKEHMIKMGYQHIEEDMFFTSAMAAASYAKKQAKSNKAAILGVSGLREAITLYGFEIEEEHPEFLFVGLDVNATYRDYSKALTILKNGAKLVGTNSDRMLPNASGFDLGNGAVVAMLEYASGQTSAKIGKPYAPILEEALHYFGLKKEDVILVGDNLETDILLGVKQGIETILVTTGVHQKEDCERLNIHPDHIISSLLEIF